MTFTFGQVLAYPVQRIAHALLCMPRWINNQHAGAEHLHPRKTVIAVQFHPENLADAGVFQLSEQVVVTFGGQ